MRLAFIMAATAVGAYILYSLLRPEVARRRLQTDLSTAAFNPAVTPEVAERIIKEIPAATQ